MHDPKQDKETRASLKYRLALLLEENHRLRHQLATRGDDSETTLEEMAHTLGASKGYYRIGQALNRQYWVRWKWTDGCLAGCYAIGGGDTLFEALLECQADVHATVNGKKTPKRDTPYKK